MWVLKLKSFQLVEKCGTSLDLGTLIWKCGHWENAKYCSSLYVRNKMNSFKPEWFESVEKCGWRRPLNLGVFLPWNLWRLASLIIAWEYGAFTAFHVLYDSFFSQNGIRYFFPLKILHKTPHKDNFSQFIKNKKISHVRHSSQPVGSNSVGPTIDVETWWIWAQFRTSWKRLWILMFDFLGGGGRSGL